MKIKIAIKPNPSSRRKTNHWRLVDAWILGEWAVIRSPGKEQPNWSVTHIASGQRVNFTCLKLKIAVGLARHLHRDMKSHWDGSGQVPQQFSDEIKTIIEELKNEN